MFSGSIMLIKQTRLKTTDVNNYVNMLIKTPMPPLPPRVNINKNLVGYFTDALLTEAVCYHSYNKKHIICYKLIGEPEEVIKKSQLSSQVLGVDGSSNPTPWKCQGAPGCKTIAIWPHLGNDSGGICKARTYTAVPWGWLACLFYPPLFNQLLILHTTTTELMPMWPSRIRLYEAPAASRTGQIGCVELPAYPWVTNHVSLFGGKEDRLPTCLPVICVYLSVGCRSSRHYSWQTA